ncbi:MAG: hypothetical protein HY649_12705 [Acidobacteria bacterium]|nr:hypothetical protein [Acidobacteriota bacterium]
MTILTAVLLLVGLMGAAESVTAWPAQESPTASSGQEVSNRQHHKAALHLGEATRSGRYEIVIPLHFVAPLEETVGNVHAELVLPGPWKFQKAELPEQSRWKVSVRQRKQEREGATPQTVLELTFSAGSRAIVTGILGLLQLASTEEDAAVPSLEVAKLETSPPVQEVVGPEAASPLPQAPPVNPAQTCFFFSH